MDAKDSRSRSGRRVAAASALIGGIAAVTAAIVIALAGCGGSGKIPDADQASASTSTQSVDEQIEKARREGKAEAERDQQMKELEAQVKQLKREQKKQKRQNKSRPASSSASSAPAPAQSASVSSPSSFTACDSNISESGTSCEFANTTFWTYWTNGQPRSISVYDASSGQYYAADCTYAGQIECRTSRGAVVRFPQAAVDLYDQSMADAYAASHNVG